MTQQSEMSERGVYRLAGAMLLQAIQDTTSSSTGRRSGALRWMRRSSDDTLFSFSFVCRVLNRDPEEVRRYCEGKAAERNKLGVHFPEVLRQQASWAGGLGFRASA
jgi:hypothetical protein